MALVFYLLLLFLHHFSFSSADPLYKKCGGANYTINSTYNSNLNNLLTFFTSLNPTSFSTWSQGSTPDLVYGLILCRGDVSSSDCTSCVQNAAQDVLSRCPTSKQATLWYDYCEFRYSDLLFFSSFENSFSPILYNTQNATGQPENFIELQRKLLDQVISEAAYNSPLLFATKTVVSEGNVTLYGLAQCTRDLSTNDCSRCLHQIWEIFTASELEASKGGRVLGESCNIRHETYPFFYYQGEQTSPSPSPFVSSPPPFRSTSYPHAPDSEAYRVEPNPTSGIRAGALLLTYLVVPLHHILYFW